ncbi:hypothetical protein KGQ20_10955 [Catenulispora sp. NF23]|uniref:hypothetical protein n=1 Tax=Catenulispora pinistramenti TaxID=2705254 RepID=UPI001BADFB02|nr:hypothetical protein [Catenulispora pinistramenti]MBS2533292.1 hypothetical protein [Catenulispora pinistramenti]
MIDRADRPTLGIYGPRLPQKSGVSTYIERSLPYLAEAFTCVRARNMPPESFENVLYHLGNNGTHHAAFRALRRRPGPIILHEYNNLDYYYQCWDLLDDNEQGLLLALVGRSLGIVLRDREELERHFARHPEVDRYCIDACCEQVAIDSATVTFVHSEYVAQFLQDRYPNAQIETLPFPVTRIGDAGEPGIRARLDLPPDAFLFGVFGFIGEYKRIEKIIEAWQRWPERPAPAVLILAGERQYELSVPAGQSIVETGYLSDDDFDQLLVSVDCGIQLRFPTLGETSGPISALIAHRRPIILSDIPEMRGYAECGDVSFVPVGDTEIPALIDAMSHQLRHARRAPEYNESFAWDTWRDTITKRLGT